MDSTARNLLVITPLMPPAVGGGGIYTDLLAMQLLDKKCIDKVVVLTERFPGRGLKDVRSQGNYIIHRMFPFRAGVSGRDVFRYFKYLYQNLLFLLLPVLIKRYAISHVMIHSSFHNYPNFMKYAIKLLTHVYLIVDVRDPKLPYKRFSELHAYNKVICCSDNVYLRLAADPVLRKKLITIPIPIDIRKPSEADIIGCKQKYGLLASRYVFSSSGIRTEKGVDLLLKVAAELRRQHDIYLVVAGKNRDTNSEHITAMHNGLLKFLGPIPYNDVLALSAGSEIDVNLSSVDSMPRASLEAIAAGARVLLPRGIPEFEKACPEFIAVSDDPVELAAQIDTIRANDLHPRYDLHEHTLSHLMHLYQGLFRNNS